VLQNQTATAAATPKNDKINLDKKLLLRWFALMETKALKKLTDTSGYRYKFLAEKLGVSKSTFSRYLSGGIMIPDEKKRVLLSIIQK